MGYNPNHFVNRETQLAAFQNRMQGTAQNSVLLFHGPLGFGKTTMLQRFREVCQKSAATCALVDFQHGGLFEAEDVIHCLRSQIRGQFFDAIGREVAAIEQDMPQRMIQPGDNLASLAGSGSRFEPQTVNASQIEGRIGEVGAGGQAAIGQNIIQNQVSINNSQIFFSPEAGIRHAQQERMRRLNRVFFEALDLFTTQKGLILLFDACDNTTPTTAEWLRAQLLDPLLTGYFSCPANLTIILVGDPTCEGGVWLNRFINRGEGIAAYPMNYLPPEAVRKYWVEIRSLDETSLPRAFAARGAPPALMIQMANLSAEV